MSDTADAVITPDAVTTPEAQAGTALVPAAPDHGRDSAMVAAAEAALQAPGAMGHSEFWALAAQARILSMSGGAPKAIREDPHLALHVAMIGRDLGISPSAAVELIDVIPGRGGEKRLSLSPQLMNGQLRRLGIGCILPAERTNTRCEAVAFGPAGPDRRCTKTGVVAHVPDCECDVLGTSEFTWEDGRLAGLVAQGCKPGDHTQKCRNSQTAANQRCNNGYVTYPKRMLWWRASGFAADDYFPEAGLGLYSPEELGATVDADGRAIDVASVEIPPGYERQAVGTGSGGGPAQAEQRADPAELWALQERLHALPAGVKDELRARWNGDESRVKGFKPHDLPATKLRAAKALVNAHWAQATAAGVDEADELAQLRKGLAVQLFLLWGQWFAPTAPQVAQEAPEAAVGTEPPEQTPEAQGGDPGAGSGDMDAAGKDWGPDLKFMHDEAQLVGGQLPEGVADAMADEIAHLHHSRINTIIQEAGEGDSYPPDSPIDLRRMVVFVLRANAFATTGEVPDDG
jgi:hypothetical protein